MIARIRKSIEEKDEGFTLIELLVVIIIIGILAAIAIPVFLNQRKKAVDSSMKSDLRSVATNEETYFVDQQKYTSNVAADLPELKLSTGNAAAVTLKADGSYCVVVTRTSGAQPGSQTAWVYESAKGGIQASGVVACT